MSANNQGTNKAPSLMSPDEWREWVKQELKMRGKKYMDVKTRTRLSYSTVCDTLSGRTSNPSILAYLAELGIEHGRNPGKARFRKAS